jgi:hypothetical protein
MTDGTAGPRRRPPTGPPPQLGPPGKVWCEICTRYVLVGDWNADRHMCSECAAEYPAPDQRGGAGMASWTGHEGEGCL